MRRLAAARVAVFGLGGVGGSAAEALARSGIGALDLIDRDVVSLTDLNRQIISTFGALGRDKAEVAAERIAAVAPDCTVTARKIFFLPETADMFDFGQYDYVVDAVDNVTAKIALVLAAREADVPIVSCMGTGNKLDPSRLCVGDLAKTRVCPLARVMRRELKKRGILHLKVVYSEEEPIPPKDAEAGKRLPPGSTAFVPPAAGLLLASVVVREIAGV